MKLYFKKGFILFTFAFATLCSNAQKNTIEANASVAKELRQKYNESPAIILNNENNIDFDLSKDQVNVIESSKEKIMSLRIENELRRTIHYDINSKIYENYVKSEKNKLMYITPVCGNYESGDIFHSDHMLCVYPLEFKQLGEIQNFSYKLNHKDIRYYTSVYFQSDIPTQKSRITFNVPDWLELELLEMNFAGYKIEKTVRKDAKKGTTVYEFIASDLDEFKNEPESYGLSHTYPHILLIAKSYRNSDGKKTNIISSINDLHNWYNQLVLQLKNDNAAFKPTVDKITANAHTDLDKVKSIYYWVQDNIRYIAFENGIAGYKPAEASDVFKQKYGDCKGMANLTKWMLKTAGYDARLVWIGTNDIPYSYNIPSLAINNHMICCVNLNKKRYYLDATEKYIGFNDYAERIQGRIVMVEDGKSYFLDTIPVLGKERNLNTINFQLSMQKDILTGKCKQKYQGESHEMILYILNNQKRETQKESKEILITSGDKNIVAENLKSSDINDKEKPFDIEADVTINNKVSNFDNDYYLDLDFYKAFNNDKVKENRKSDLCFDEKKFQKMTVNLTIPANFKIKHLPSPLEMKEKNFSFIIKYSVKNNVINYERTISIDNGNIPRNEIDKWNNAIKALSEKYNDNVILTKK